MSSYENFKKYEVKDVNSVKEFHDKYHKECRYTGRGQDYAQCVINSSVEDLKKYGFTFITHHDSKTSECVSYYGNI